jgi:uncharacterized delta-60 repeat protein
MKTTLLLAFTFLLVFKLNAQLDLTYGTGGFVRLGGTFSSTAFTPDGKLVGVNAIAGGFVVYRYDTNGALDPSFGNGGVVSITFPEFAGTTRAMVATTSDGKIVVEAVGRTTNPSLTEYLNALIRLNNNGSVDTSFGTEGMIKKFYALSDSNYGIGLQQLAVQNDGKIVSIVDLIRFGTEGLVYRYNADGSLDASSDGNVHYIPSVHNIYGGRIFSHVLLAVQNDSKTLISYVSPSQSVGQGDALSVLRLTNESLTTVVTYTTTVIPPISYDATALAGQDDGKILMYMHEGAQFKLVRLNEDGTRDASFGNDGVVVSPPITISKILVQSNGKIIVAGSFFNGTNNDFAVARYNANGTLDLAFGNGGIMITDFGGSESIENIGIAGNRLYAYGNGIVAAYGLTSGCTPPTFVKNALIILDATCGNKDGNVNIIPTSGTAPFMYSIDGGVTYVSGPSTGYGFQGLAAGTYKLRLKDANGCESAIVERTVQALNCGPVITSIAPTSGPVGTTVTITGTGFDPVPANNIVYFGAVKATVVSATPTTITVQAPAGSTYGPITVTTNGRTASLLQPFMVTCPAAGFSFSLNEKTDIAGVGNIDIVDWDGDGKADMIRGATILRNTSSGSNISFVESITMPITGRYATGDIDGDGRIDLAIINASSNTVSIFRNTSTVGNISFASAISVPTGLNPESVAIGDLDGDGKPELVVAKGSATSIFRNLSSTGNISFAAVSDVPARNHATESIAIGDLDGDGKPDLVVVHENTAISVFRNTSSYGNISFATRVDLTANLELAENIHLVDLDGDGKLDIVAKSYQFFSIFRNTSSNGSISFASPSNINVAGYFRTPTDIAVGDIDGDGKPDLAVTHSDFVDSDGDPHLPYRTVELYINKSTSGAISLEHIPVPKEPFHFDDFAAYVAIGDLDGDGKSDLITTSGNTRNTSIFRNLIACTTACIPPTFKNDALIILDATCANNDGNINIIPTSGTAPFMYSINGGVTYVAGPNAGYGFQNLPSGIYKLRLKDANGCESAIVEREVKLLCNTCTPPTFVNNNLIILDASCGKSDGAINIIPTSGTAPFMYSINGGATYVAGPDAGYGFQNLPAGTYQLRLKDSRGCESAIVERTVRNYYNCPGITGSASRFEAALALSNKDVIATYPNPNKGQFKLLLQNFLSPKAEVSVYDAKGTLVQKRSLNLTQNTIADFDLKGKAPGLYLIKVASSNGTKVSKVLIQ